LIIHLQVVSSPNCTVSTLHNRSTTNTTRHLLLAMEPGSHSRASRFILAPVSVEFPICYMSPGWQVA